MYVAQLRCLVNISYFRQLSRLFLLFCLLDSVKIAIVVHLFHSVEAPGYLAIAPAIKSLLLFFLDKQCILICDRAWLPDYCIIWTLRKSVNSLVQLIDMLVGLEDIFVDVTNVVCLFLVKT
jgi:hypothetical protein